MSVILDFLFFFFFFFPFFSRIILVEISQKRYISWAVWKNFDFLLVGVVQDKRKTSVRPKKNHCYKKITKQIDKQTKYN